MVCPNAKLSSSVFLFSPLGPGLPVVCTEEGFTLVKVTILTPFSWQQESTDSTELRSILVQIKRLLFYEVWSLEDFLLKIIVEKRYGFHAICIKLRSRGERERFRGNRRNNDNDDHSYNNYKNYNKKTMITKTKSEIFSRLEVTDKRWQVSRRTLGLSLRPLKLMRRGNCLMWVKKNIRYKE